jgi:hypothetical protein
MFEYARFQSSRLNVDLGSESSGFFAFGSSCGTRSMSPSSSSSSLGFFSALGLGSALGFSALGSFAFASAAGFSFFGGVKTGGLSRYSASPKTPLISGTFVTVSKKRMTFGMRARSSAPSVLLRESFTVCARKMSAAVMRSVTRKVRLARCLSTRASAAWLRSRAVV